jgi:hypothetical protein
MSELIAGRTLPWEHISGYFLRVHDFLTFAKVEGEAVGPPMLGAYGLLKAQVPNPDILPEQRIIALPVENKSDYKSLFRAHLDSNVQAKHVELVVLFENRRGFFGGRKPSFHVAAFPDGTWKRFYESVENYSSDKFQWPTAYFLYQPSALKVFQCTTNLFSV